MAGALPALLVVLITILVPPVGVAIVSGCGMDLFINICLTLLGCKLRFLRPSIRCPSPLLLTTPTDIPGHIHAFYLEYVYFDRRERAQRGELTGESAPGVYSDRVQSGGLRQQGYGTL